MSSVTQSLMAEGSATINLHAAAPRKIVETIEQFSQIIITPARLALGTFDELVAASRWVGRVQDRPGSTNTIVAAGALAWMGTAAGVQRYTIDATDASTSPQAMMVDLFDPTTNTNGLALGTYSSLPATPYWVAREYADLDAYEGPRKFLDRLHDQLGWVYAVRGLTVDIGETAADIFRTDEVLVSNGLPFTDFSLRMVPAVIDVRRTDGDYAGGVNVRDGTYSGWGFPASWPDNAAGAATSYDAYFAIVQGQDLGSGSNASDQADLEIATTYAPDKRYVSIRADLDDPAAHIEPGDTILVSAPEAGLIDTTNEVDTPLGVLYPESMDVVGLTWQIGEGMGVYLVQNSDHTDITDLTDLVEIAPGPASIDVGFRQPTIAEVVNGRN